MKYLIKLTLLTAFAFGFVACGTETKKETVKSEKSAEESATPEKPTVAELHAYKAYHHSVNGSQ